MIKINRIKAVSKTEKHDFGFDYKLNDGLNLIASEINTRGKSSAILAIYYCLGFEEIVGGKGMKTLTSVYKNSVKDEYGKVYNVLQSHAWIEISNGNTTVTLSRAAEIVGCNENLITVYYCDMDSIYDSSTYIEDMYVHIKNATTSSKGFHFFLEKFMGLELPLVPTNSEVEYKLYLQLLFSAIFIEQKRGWADLFSAMPVLGIKDAKKRVIEYLLNLDTLTNEKKRASLKLNELNIQRKWEVITKEIQSTCNREDCRIHGLALNPSILNEDFENQINITIIGENCVSLEEKIQLLGETQKTLISITPKIIDNYDELQKELDITQQSIFDIENKLENQRTLVMDEKAIILKLSQNLETINSDIRNNKDALKLKKMGSKLGIDSYNGVCPFCHQSIQDSLLPSQINDCVMSIEENISHLESQKSMIRFALNGHENNKNEAEQMIKSLLGKIFTLQRLAKSIRNDLYSVDDNISETIVYKKIKIENKIEQLNTLKSFVNGKLIELKRCSQEWKKHLDNKKRLPRASFSENDRNKIIALGTHFKEYLEAFNYQSVSDFSTIEISFENYLPISEGFDMKFDSSASDNIRAIWAYTLALLHTSIEKDGNHPQVVMFDEPAQHSIVPNDVISLFNSVVKIPGSKQVIFGITLSDSEIRKAVKEFDSQAINIIDVGNQSFKLLNGYI